MRSAFFCWQNGSKQPCPVIVYDNLPSDKGPEAAGRPKILSTHKIPEEHFNGDEVSLSFNQLATMFPPPRDVLIEEVVEEVVEDVKAA